MVARVRRVPHGDIRLPLEEHPAQQRLDPGVQPGAGVEVHVAEGEVPLLDLHPVVVQPEDGPGDLGVAVPERARGEEVLDAGVDARVVAGVERERPAEQRREVLAVGDVLDVRRDAAPGLLVQGLVVPRGVPRAQHVAVAVVLAGEDAVVHEQQRRHVAALVAHHPQLGVGAPDGVLEHEAGRVQGHLPRGVDQQLPPSEGPQGPRPGGVAAVHHRGVQEGGHVVDVLPRAAAQAVGGARERDGRGAGAVGVEVHVAPRDRERERVGGVERGQGEVVVDELAPHGVRVVELARVLVVVAAGVHRVRDDAGVGLRDGGGVAVRFVVRGVVLDPQEGGACGPPRRMCQVVAGAVHRPILDAMKWGGVAQRKDQPPQPERHVCLPRDVECGAVFAKIGDRLYRALPHTGATVARLFLLFGCEATDTQLPYDPRDTGHRSSPTTLFLLFGGGGVDLRDPPTTDFWQTQRPTNVPTPRGGGGYWTPTHPPIHPYTIGKMPHHRQNTLTSTFGADPGSPTMAYPTGGGGGGGWKPTRPEILTNPHRVAHTLRKTLAPPCLSIVANRLLNPTPPRKLNGG